MAAGSGELAIRSRRAGLCSRSFARCSSRRFREATRSAAFLRERHSLVASTWQARHQELKRSSVRRLGGKSSAGLTCEQWLHAFLLARAVFLTFSRGKLRGVHGFAFALDLPPSGRETLTGEVSRSVVRVVTPRTLACPSVRERVQPVDGLALRGRPLIGEGVMSAVGACRALCRRVFKRGEQIPADHPAALEWPNFFFEVDD